MSKNQLLLMFQIYTCINSQPGKPNLFIARIIKDENYFNDILVVSSKKDRETAIKNLKRKAKKILNLKNLEVIKNY
jgi:hypothetical protein